SSVRLLSISSLFFSLLMRLPPSSTPFPYTTLFRSPVRSRQQWRDLFGRQLPAALRADRARQFVQQIRAAGAARLLDLDVKNQARSEEHTSELQSRENLVCRLLLEKKKIMLSVIRVT